MKTLRTTMAERLSLLPIGDGLTDFTLHRTKSNEYHYLLVEGKRILLSQSRELHIDRSLDACSSLSPTFFKIRQS